MIEARLLPHQLVPNTELGAAVTTSLAAIHVFCVELFNPFRSNGMKAETTKRSVLSAATATWTWQTGCTPAP